MAKMVGFSRPIKLEWLDKVSSLVMEGKTNEEVKKELHEYLSFEITSPTNLRKTREILLSIWVRCPEDIKQLALEAKKSGSTKDVLAVHWALILLAYPLFWDTASLMGKVTNLQDSFTTNWLKTKLSIVIKDDSGVTVANGVSSTSYTLAAKYEGIHTWTIIGTDKVGHTTSTTITTKYDITKPGIDGTEITDVINGVTVSGYCQDNIISQHIDDEASRSVNNPNCTSGLKSILVYKVKNGVKTAIYSSQTQATFGTSDTHSAFDVYYDVNATDEYMDYYLVTVKDYAGNINTKKLTTQRSLLTWFHTSIEKSSYGN